MVEATVISIIDIDYGGNAVSRTSSATRPKGSATASLLLRLTVGPMLVFHGYSKIFGGGGLGGTARYFEKLGLRPGVLHAGLGAGTEIGAGTLMTVGALSPLPAAGAIGLMATAARTDHKGKGVLVFKGGWEYTGVVAAAAAAMAALGPGPLSVDRIRGKERSGLVWTGTALAVGLGSAAGLLSRVKTEPAAEVSPT
ncbi:MAG: DoxX family protein [Actinomycetota bacterium]|nr:DoxX family protein [Actinomycetota bacterium]